MDKKPLSPSQVFAITNAEQHISNFFNDSEYKFTKIIDLIEKNNIEEHENIMQYLYSLLASKGYSPYAEEFAKKYNIQIAKTD